MASSDGANGWALRLGWIIIAVVSVLFIVVAAQLVVKPLATEEEFAGTTFEELQVANPQLANVIQHYSAGIGVLIIGSAFLALVLAATGIRRGSRLAWYAALIVGATFLVSIVLAHVPTGHTEASHVGAPIVLLVVYFVGLVLSARALLWPQRVGARSPVGTS